jgi:hypothetical protein
LTDGTHLGYLENCYALLACELKAYESGDDELAEEEFI